MSKKLDLLGAPSSNAGDAFHETWALREALRLLDPASELTSLSVEGVRDDAETDETARWDGVDCALYFVGKDEPENSRVELVQLKYSSASPGLSWTPYRFFKSTKKKGDNSVARRLAQAFRSESKNKTNEQVRKSIKIRLVTNQPISDKLLNIINMASHGTLTGDDFEQLKKATGLSNPNVKLFCECLTLEGGEKSRDAMRVDSTLTVSNILQAPSADIMDGLLMRIRERMLPEGTKNIEKTTVISWFGVGQEEGLFPCEPRLELLDDVIPRETTAVLAKKILAHSLVCFHGEGGSGKTTIAKTLNSMLPTGSCTILYDCFGAGAYRDQSQCRHRPYEAFLQLSNELSKVTNTPYFYPYSNRSEMARAFRNKLVMAARIFDIERPGALLVILIDAADNAVHAAASFTPQQECFVKQLITFNELPSNVRIVISSRTARLESLNLPESTVQVVCPPFSLEETVAFVTMKGLTGSESTIEDFHELSTHNPRVQSNAIETAKKLADAIALLLPNGQSLPDLFDAMIDTAKRRAGVETSTARLCATLSILPTPAPVLYIAAVCDIDVESCSDLLVEMTQRNVRLSNRGVDLTNEDFEAYCEENGHQEIANVTLKAADLLMQNRLTSDYAATHLFGLLVQAGRKTDLQTCLEEPNALDAIKNPLKRRQVEKSRFRSVLHVASLGGDDLSIAKTIYIGAESIPSSSKVEQVMRGNPDLSAAFTPDTIAPLVLNAPEMRNEHGPLLMHLSAEHVRKREFFDARMRIRAANEWFNELFDKPDLHSHEWSYKDRDVIASLMGYFQQGGWRMVSKMCGRWSPKSYALHLRVHFLKRIALEHSPNKIVLLLSEIEPEYLFLALNALVRGGQRPAITDLTIALSTLKETTFKEFEVDESSTVEMTYYQRFIDEVLFFLDHASQERKLESDCLQILDRLPLPQQIELKCFSLYHPYTLDFILRVRILRARLASQPLDLVSVFSILEKPKDNKPASEANHMFNQLMERKCEIDKLIPVYEALAAASLKPGEKTRSALIQKFVTLQTQTHREYMFGNIRRVIGRRALEMLAIQDADMVVRLKTLSSLACNDAQYTVANDDWLLDLLHNPRAHTPVTELMEAQATELKKQNLKATEKAEGLISIARMFLPFHRSNSKVYFLDALRIVEEVDLETLDVLHALCRMIKPHQPDTPEMRKRAARLARLVHVAGNLLQSEDGFPQDEAVRALMDANLPVAAATISRWTDDGFENDLTTFTEYGIASGLFTPHEGLLLSGLGLSSNARLELKVLETAVRSMPSQVISLVEEIIQSKLLAIEPGKYEDIYRDIRTIIAALELPPETRKKVNKRLTFIETHADGQEIMDKQKPDTTFIATQNETELSDWLTVDPLDAEALSKAQCINRDAGVYNQERFFTVMREKTGVADRERHLEALAAAARCNKFPDAEIRAILKALELWTGAAENNWRRQYLPELVVDLGNKTLGYSWYDQTYFEALLKVCDLSDRDTLTLIVRLIETHADNLGSMQLLKLLAHFVRRLPIDDSNNLIDFFIKRLETHVSSIKGVEFTRCSLDTSALPQTSSEITATLLYRFLGDMDARLRWRAAHKLHQAVRIGASDLIGKVLAVALRGNFHQYTFADCPFQELSADLQLTIVLARISYEAPILIAEHEESLKSLWAKQSPHLLIGHYLSRAFKQVMSAGVAIHTTLDELASMTGDAATRVSRIADLKNERLERSFGIGELFHFNCMDVIPYWYNPALAIFTNLSQTTLIDTAEKWIVEKWGGSLESSNWQNEPRRRRLDNNYQLSSIRNGRRPTLDTHSFYLQWHGLFAAMGELLKTYSLCEFGDADDRNSYENWLSRHDTTYAGVWLADIRSPLPLDVRYWRLPQPTRSEWIVEPLVYDLSKEFFTEDGAFVLHSHREVQMISHSEEAANEVVASKSAFVSSETSSALLRTFSMMPNHKKISFPDPDLLDGEKPTDPRFLLISAVSFPLEDRDSGVDIQDPDRFGVQGVQVIPSSELKEAVGLIENAPWSTEWCVAGCSSPAAIYTVWSSLPNWEHDSYRYQNNKVCVNGDRLSLDLKILKEAMEKLDCDLVVTVHITRSIGEKYAKINKIKQTRESRSEAFLLRRDGSIESTSGDFGTWADTCNTTR